MEKYGSLEIDEDFPHHKSAWKVKRVGWAILFILVVLALAGYTGGGLSSDRTVTNAQISVTYQRIARRSSEVPFKILIPSEEADTIKVQFTSDYLSDMVVKNINPMPVLTSSGQGIFNYYFKNARMGQTQLVFYLKPEKFGSFHFNVRVNDSELSLNQLILP